MRYERDLVSTEPSTAAAAPTLARATLLWAWLVACAALYLGLELAYVERLPMITDEFDGAFDVYRLSREIPYVDFRPYKTVLGYYAQLPLLLGAPDVWSGLVRVKVALTVLNALLLVLAALRLSRIFSPLAAALLLPTWVLMTEWLERSSELRVDTLTAWPGLFSLLVLIDRRAGLAGVLAGLSFLVSQKGAYYIAASAAALLLQLALALRSSREARTGALRELARFGAGCGLVVAPYFIAFSLAGALDSATSATFLSHRAIIFEDLYPNIRKFWRATLVRNFGFYALAVLGCLALTARSALARRAGDEGRARIAQLTATYGVVLGALGIWHKQPWPYFFVLIIPFAYVLAVGGLHAVEPHLRSVGSPARRWLARLALAAVLVLTLASPIARVAVILRERSGYQRHMVELASRLVAPDEHYLAAMDVLYDRKQSSKKLARVSVSRRRELARMSREQIDAILDELRAQPPKLLIRNERFTSFPAAVKRFLATHYAPYWGSLELYAPKLGRRDETIELAFTGTYRVDVAPGRSLHVDGEVVEDGEHVALARGPHAVDVDGGARLYLQAPELDALRDPRYSLRREFMGNAYNR